jgi:hypothetical protein
MLKELACLQKGMSINPLHPASMGRPPFLFPARRRHGSSTPSRVLQPLPQSPYLLVPGVRTFVSNTLNFQSLFQLILFSLFPPKAVVLIAVKVKRRERHEYQKNVAA